MNAVHWNVVADACAGVALAGYEIRDLHWVSGEDGLPELDYCRDCAQKAIDDIKAKNPAADLHLDGGWRMDQDGQRFCATCEVPLDGSFTDYAVESELEHFLGLYHFDIASPSDCHSLRTMLECYPWRGSEHSTRVRHLAFQAIRQSLERAQGAAPTADTSAAPGAVGK